jgi:hypothetical protein
VDASKPTTRKNPFADERGLPAQRFCNLLCMAYGAGSKLFADLVEKEYLPKERAEGCEGEYEQVKYAVTKLVGPCIDPARAKRVREKRWLRFDVQCRCPLSQRAIAGLSAADQDVREPEFVSPGEYRHAELSSHPTQLANITPTAGEPRRAGFARAHRHHSRRIRNRY